MDPAITVNLPLSKVEEKKSKVEKEFLETKSIKYMITDF